MRDDRCGGYDQLRDGPPTPPYADSEYCKWWFTVTGQRAVLFLTACYD